MKRRYSFSLILVYAVGFLVGTSYGMHGPILPIFAKNVIGASYSELGFIGFANFIPYMFIPAFVGLLLDRFNNGYLLALGVIVNSSAIFLLSIVQSVPEIMVFRIMTGIAHGFFWPPCESIISRSSNDKDKVKNIGGFAGFFVFGFMIGPLIGTFLIEDSEVSYRMLFQLAAIVLASAIIASLLVSRRQVKGHVSKFNLAAIKEMRRFPEIIAILIFCNATFATILTIYPAFLDDKGMSSISIELLYFFFGVARVSTFWIVGRLERKTSISVILSIITISGGLALSFFASSIEWFTMALILLGFGFSVFFPLTFGIVLSKTQKTMHGTIIGAYETMFGIGWVIGPISAGILSEYYGNEAPYMVFFVIGTAVTIISIIKKKTLEPQADKLKSG